MPTWGDQIDPKQTSTMRSFDRFLLRLVAYDLEAPSVQPRASVRVENSLVTRDKHLAFGIVGVVGVREEAESRRDQMVKMGKGYGDEMRLWEDCVFREDERGHRAASFLICGVIRDSQLEVRVEVLHTDDKSAYYDELNTFNKFGE
ncbi:hypothetical protein TREMEDRAFT_58304 [Tremella mesenterica DSM 1558]|uniref:uncharacterized protein n=1 Tax=Tremella mesenterica (strain ATCC 24925 / CBS 8224 / DSM 1558 / NBRC 9311 / NRRL Y-6157 / RJB 2259-6 / UBC 559-6) TaxID=578456 RepID=UPI0003F49B7C|nr:uncharacterized protein TREMEDRAFT_58304 [Tremella mesenterica DSM 1558]EIW72148.1 hypothetical protein TREMEDRAFT_58304 [Tremella mesenterica DSM 1558]